jgi:hypothetical protein
MDAAEVIMGEREQRLGKRSLHQIFERERKGYQKEENDLYLSLSPALDLR